MWTILVCSLIVSARRMGRKAEAVDSGRTFSEEVVEEPAPVAFSIDADATTAHELPAKHKAASRTSRKTEQVPRRKLWSEEQVPTSFANLEKEVAAAEQQAEHSMDTLKQEVGTESFAELEKDVAA